MTKKPTRPKRATRPTKPQPDRLGAPQNLDLLERLSDLDICPPKNAAKAQEYLLEVRNSVARRYDELHRAARRDLIESLDRELARIFNVCAVGVLKANPRVFSHDDIQRMYTPDEDATS
jgi:hypothetical protein